MKFERGLETEAIDIEFLSSNWEKFVILRANRWMEFHSRHGKHYNMRMPLSGTSLAYNAPMCELYTTTIKNLVFRTNLEQGRYFAPFETKIDHINSCDIDTTHLLCSFGGNNGIVECWDPRSKECIAKLDMFDSIPDISPTPGIEKIKFGNDGLTLAVGLSSGHTGVYDIRRYKPLYVLNQKNHISIRDINFHSQSNTIITADSKSIRYWKLSDGELYTIIQPSECVNSICSVENSGILFVGQEQHRIGSYYVPSIGCAPKWCPFLDSMTDELEENKYQSIYYNYKFITNSELEGLGLTHLIGTNLLKPYMHGFYIDLKLYKRVKAIVDPDAYEKFLKMKTKEKIDEKRSGRIGIKTAVGSKRKNYDGNADDDVGNEMQQLVAKQEMQSVKVNKGYANYLIDKSQNVINTRETQLEREMKENERRMGINDNDNESKSFENKDNDIDTRMALEPLIDPRFNMMFKNEEFDINNDRLMKDLQFRPELLRNDDILNAMQYDTIKQYAISQGFGSNNKNNNNNDNNNNNNGNKNDDGKQNKSKNKNKNKSKDKDENKEENDRIVSAKIIDKLVSGDGKINSNHTNQNDKRNERFLDSDDDDDDNELEDSDLDVAQENDNNENDSQEMDGEINDDASQSDDDNDDESNRDSDEDASQNFRSL